MRSADETRRASSCQSALSMKPITCRVVARHRHTLVSADEHDEGIGKGSPREQLLRARLDRIAALARRMLDQARVNPQTPVSGLVSELTRIVEEMEGYAAVDGISSISSIRMPESLPC